MVSCREVCLRTPSTDATSFFRQSLIEQYPTTGLSALWSAFLQTAAVADAARSSDEEWWKGYESALALVGAVAGDLIEAQEEGGSMGGFDLEKIFGEVVPAFLGSAGERRRRGRAGTGTLTPVVRCRATVPSRSQLRVCLAVRQGTPCRTRQPVHRRRHRRPSHERRQCSGQGVCRSRTQQVSTIVLRGLPFVPIADSPNRSFFRHLKTSVDSSRAVQALVQLLPLLPQTSDNTLVLVVETVESTLKVAGPALDAETCAEVVKQVLTTWFETPGGAELYSHLYSDASMLIFLRFHLCRSHSRVNHRRGLHLVCCFVCPRPPTLPPHIGPTRPHPNTHGSFRRSSFGHRRRLRRAARLDLRWRHLAPSARNVRDCWWGAVRIDAADRGSCHCAERSVCRHQRREKGRRPASELVSGTRLVRYAVSLVSDQCLSSCRTNALGQPGMELILGQVAKLLEPSESEAGGLFVGDLVIHLIRKAGNALGPVLPDLLKAFVTRLATAETSTFSQVS